MPQLLITKNVFKYSYRVSKQRPGSFLVNKKIKARNFRYRSMICIYKNKLVYSATLPFDKYMALNMILFYFTLRINYFEEKCFN